MYDQIDEKYVRGLIRDILKEEPKQLREIYDFMSEDEFTRAFVDPFTDVFKVAKVALKDVLTSAKFAWDAVVTFDPLKLKQQRENFKARKAKIAEEYKEVMEPTWKALGNEDLKAATFLLNPVGFLVAAPAVKALKNRKEIADYFREAGFGTPSEKEEEEGTATEPVGVLGAVFNKLKGIFFSEAASVDDMSPLLREQDDGGESKEEMIRGVAEEMGILGKLESGGDKVMSQTIANIKEIEELVRPRLEALTALERASNPDELQQALDLAKQSDIDLGGPMGSDVQKALDASVEEIEKDPEAAEELEKAIAGMSGNLGEQDEPGNLGTAEPEEGGKAADVIFAQAMGTSIRPSVADAKQELYSQLDQMLMAAAPEGLADDKVRAQIEASDTGQKIVGMLEKTHDELRNIGKQ